VLIRAKRDADRGSHAIVAAVTLGIALLVASVAPAAAKGQCTIGITRSASQRTCIYVARGLLDPPSRVRHVISWGDGKRLTVVLGPREEQRIRHRYPGPGVYTIVDTPTYLIDGTTYTVRFTLRIATVRARTCCSKPTQ